MGLVGIPSGAFASKFGCMFLSNWASAMLTLGMLLIGAAIMLASIPMVLVGLVLVGLSIGLNEGPSIQRITTHSPPEQQGSSGGLIFTVMNVGSVLGVGLFSVVAEIISEAPLSIHPKELRLSVLQVRLWQCLPFLAASVLARNTIKC